MKNDLAVLLQKLRTLKLPAFADLAEEDFKKLSPDQKELVLSYLHTWTETELTSQRDKTIQRRIMAADFVQIQTVDTYDFNYNTSTKKIRSEYMELLDETEKAKLPRAVFIGTSGLGKTHLARSLGYMACQAKTTVLFVNTAKMINRLSTAKNTYTLEKELNKYRRPRVLILDEIGYVTMSTEDSNLFFQVISARHDMGLGTIATANTAFGEWNQVFAANATAHAIIDRLADGASVFHLEGPSYREYRRQQMKKKKKQ